MFFRLGKHCLPNLVNAVCQIRFSRGRFVMPFSNVVPAGACAERSRSMTESPFLFEMPDGWLKIDDGLR